MVRSGHDPAHVDVLSSDRSCRSMLILLFDRLTHPVSAHQQLARQQALRPFRHAYLAARMALADYLCSRDRLWRILSLGTKLATDSSNAMNFVPKSLALQGPPLKIAQICHLGQHLPDKAGLHCVCMVLLGPSFLKSPTHSTL